MSVSFNLADNPPDDTVSDLAFAPHGNYIGVGSWDGTARIWQIGDNAAGFFKCRAPEKQEAVLRIAWDPDSTRLYYGTTGGKIGCLTVEGKQTDVCNGLIGPISGLKYWEEGGSLIVATLKGYMYQVYTDGTQEPIMIYSKEVAKIDDLSITNIAIGKNWLYFIGIRSTPRPDCLPPDNVFMSANLAAPSGRVEFKPVPHTMTIPLMCVAVSSNDMEWAIGGVNGKIEYKPENDSETKIEKGFCVETHKKLYAVNCLASSPERPLFAAGGGNGELIYITPNKRAKPIKWTGKPVTAITFAYQNGLIAAATGNDWAEGSQSYFKKDDAKIPEIVIKKIQQSDYP